MGAIGSDAAIEAADVVLMDDDIGKLAVGMKVARSTRRIVNQNVTFALGFKILVLLLSHSRHCDDVDGGICGCRCLRTGNSECNAEEGLSREGSTEKNRVSTDTCFFIALLE